MKKALLILLALTAIGTGAWARQSNIGVGVEYVFSYGPVGALNGFAITGKPPVLPIVLGVSLSFGSEVFNLGVTADWWLWQTGIAGPLSLYAGPGLFLGLGLGGDPDISFGARGVIGLQFFPIDPLEFFLEGGINVGLRVGDPTTLTWGIPVAVGARFWF